MGLKRDIVKHTTVYSASRILEKLVGFLLLPLYAHIFQTEGYGVIGMVDSATTMLVVTFAYGFHHAIVRIYHDEPPERQPLVVSTAVLVTAGLGSIVVALPVTFSSPLAAWLIGDAAYATILSLAFVTVLVALIGKAANSYLVIRQQSWLYSAVGLLHVVLGIGLNILLVLVLQIGLVGIFIASLITTSIATAIFVWAAFREFRPRFDQAIAMKLVRFQGPLVPAEILAFFSRHAERLLVRFQIDLSAVGVLEMAYKFPPMISMFFVAPFMLAWRTRSMALAKEPNAPLVMGHFLTYFTFALLWIAVVFAVSMGPVLRLLTPPDFWAAAPIARVEVVTAVLFGLISYMEFGLLYAQLTTRLAVLKSVLAVIKVAVSVVLIRQFGLAGAAYSAALMELAQLVWVSRISQRAFPIHIEWARLATIAVMAVGVYLIVGWVEHLSNGPVPWLASQIELATRGWDGSDLPALFRRIHTIVLEREMAMAALLVNATLASLYGLSVLALGPDARRYLWNIARRPAVLVGRAVMD